LTSLDWKKVFALHLQSGQVHATRLAGRVPGNSPPGRCGVGSASVRLTADLV